METGKLVLINFTEKMSKKMCMVDVSGSQYAVIAFLNVEKYTTLYGAKKLPLER